MDAPLAEWVADSIDRLLAGVVDLDPERLQVPYLPTINPPLWEVCHAAYFLEYWVLRRHAGLAPSRDDVDALFDSMTIAHETRWRLPLPDFAETRAYAETVRDRVLERIDRSRDDRERYLIAYAVFHADMHLEAIAYCRQALGLPAPDVGLPRGCIAPVGPADGDVEFRGGAFELGARDDGSFCFDNEKWAHEVTVEPFALARRTVTEGEFAAFVADDGYRRDELWSHEGRAWRESVQAERPLYWRRGGSGFERRTFDTWEPLDPDRAMMHVSYYECDAFARWAGRRLPTEPEWEFAAASAEKRAQPWGDEPPDIERANLDLSHAGAVTAAAYPTGQTPEGLCQMVGNVWEWTSSRFTPYPSFLPDMYRDYSQTSFGTRNVLRGGCWITRSRMIRNTWRDYYPKSRRDVFAGFRTCAT